MAPPKLTRDTPISAHTSVDEKRRGEEEEEEEEEEEVSHLIFSSQRYQVASWKSGRIFRSPLRTAATALAAMVLQLTYHWGVIIGSMMSPEREHKPSLILFGSLPRNNPSAVRASSMAIRASYLISPGEPSGGRKGEMERTDLRIGRSCQ
jgi:hypothetical protein